MEKKKFSFKRDQYKDNRGEYSRFLNIFCERCESHLFLYQKDGPGELRRMYLDRILAPEVPKGKKEIACKSCGKVFGTHILYEKENRPAIRLYQGAVIKRVGKGMYPM